MLISCPKCHSIYEIPDDLIGKTGRNFRCHACANLWHAMREDALDYVEDEKDTAPYIEPIEVKDERRGFPADKAEYIIPADSHAGVRTQSSEEVLRKEAVTKTEDQITLTSEHGTSFTISTSGEYQEELKEKNRPHLYEPEEENAIHADKEKRLTLEPKFKGYRKTVALLFLLTLCCMVLFLRREIVALYPEAETWYNKIYLSGLDNGEYLKMNIVKAEETNTDGKATLTLTVNVYNPSLYSTYVPEIVLEGSDKTYQTKAKLLGAEAKTTAEIIIPKPEDNASLNINLSFKRPQYDFNLSHILERIK